MTTLIILIVTAVLAIEPTWELQLSTGEVLRGRLIEQTEQLVIFEHPVLGRLEIPVDGVRSLHELPSEPPPVIAPPPAAETAGVTVVPPALDDAIVVEPQKAPKGTWDSKFSLGLNASSGKTEESSLRMNLDSVYEDSRKKLTFDAFYLSKTTDGDITENKLTAGVRGNWPWEGSSWGYFGQGRYDFDEFQSWRHRVTGGAGLTYLLADFDNIDPENQDSRRLDRFTLTGNGGLGFNKEFGSVDADVSFEGILGVELAWNISRRQRLSFDWTYFPNISEQGQYRLVSRGTWSLKLDRMDGISLNLGYNYEFQSRRDPGVDPNDLQIYATIGVDF